MTQDYESSRRIAWISIFFSSAFFISIKRDSTSANGYVDFKYIFHLKERFNNFPLLEFHKNYVLQKQYPNICRHTIFMASLCSSTYYVWAGVLQNNHVKCLMKSWITDNHLESLFQIDTSVTMLDFGNAVCEKQCQIFHQHL